MNELCHHGILGQRWGIRRTPEQLGHHPSLDIKIKKKKNISKSHHVMSGLKFAKQNRRLIDFTIQEVTRNPKSAANQRFIDRPIKSIHDAKKEMLGLNFTQQMMSQQQMNQNFIDWSMQESTRSSINTANQAMSLGMSGGMNMFTFGVM